MDGVGPTSSTPIPGVAKVSFYFGESENSPKFNMNGESCIKIRGDLIKAYKVYYHTIKISGASSCFVVHKEPSIMKTVS